MNILKPAVSDCGPTHCSFAEVGSIDDEFDIIGSEMVNYRNTLEYPVCQSILL